MPKYDMRCNNCGKEFKVEHSYIDTVEDKCPYCKSKKVKRLIMQANTVIYIGDGFTKANQKLTD